jgi:hypothetical protein
MNAGAPPFDLRTTVPAIARAWQAFFHTPVDARLCAGIRIGYALAILINLACWYPDLERWFTDLGVLPAADLPALKANERWSLLLWMPSELFYVQLAFAIFAAQAVLLLLGVGARFNAVCVLVWLSSFQNRNPLIWDSEDMLLRLIGAYVVLMPCGEAWSLNRLWRRPESICALVPGWGLRLLQIQMAFIFATAAWHKLNGDAWQNGTAMFYVVQLDDFYGRLPLPRTIFEIAWLSKLVTWSVIAIEIIAPVGVWFQQTRRAALGLALCFHLGNELLMHLYLFHWLMLLGWSSFLLPRDFAWLRKRESSGAA